MICDFAKVDQRICAAFQVGKDAPVDVDQACQRQSDEHHGEYNDAGMLQVFATQVHRAQPKQSGVDREKKRRFRFNASDRPPLSGPIGMLV